ncbi:hypothetical protein A3844_01880 [Paenibacillus helianthi]|uniref:Uncharacterized protein n=1 Tax=Paenibacillus helianthi TaxID=1349432 RepID=A0ABX3EVQ4_9BACL|nr:hypothetical protein A3844_01880 [Paenibacillus helianthi]
MYDVQESIKAQEIYCEENKAPHFAPKTGRCWSCNQNIYAPGHHVWKGKSDGRESAGISVEKAGRELVTGCPHCFRSYCD